jgi:hypothetical protein
VRARACVTVRARKGDVGPRSYLRCLDELHERQGLLDTIEDETTAEEPVPRVFRVGLGQIKRFDCRWVSLDCFKEELGVVLRWWVGRAGV